MTDQCDDEGRTRAPLKIVESCGMQRLAHDYSAPWQRGYEHIAQDGSPVWEEIRNRHELTREAIEELSGGVICWEEVQMLEDRPGLPTLDQLVFYARLEGTSLGALLDRVLEAKGRALIAEEVD